MTCAILLRRISYCDMLAVLTHQILRRISYCVILAIITHELSRRISYCDVSYYAISVIPGRGNDRGTLYCCYDRLVIITNELL